MNTERTPLPENTPQPRFSQNFWGKDDAGYSALTTRMRHAKLTCQEILGMFQARAALEEEYGKKLLKLSKSPLGKDELGSLRDSLDVVRYEIEATGKSHVELAGKMREQLELALAEFNNTQKDKRKLHQASIDRTFRNKQLYLQQLVKAKEKYDAECIRTKGLSAAKMNLVGKELDRVSLKMEKTELASRAADVEYQASIRQLAEINDKWIVEWRVACDKFQMLEEQRIDYLRTTLWNYANIVSGTCVADDESCERIRSSLELCDVNQNLQSFIETCATGEVAPDIPTYLSLKSPDASEGVLDCLVSSRVPTQEPRARAVGAPHQPVPNVEGSAPSSRRQSTYSADCILETDGGPAVDMALAVGNNVFKLDANTAALLNQTDDPAIPASAGHPTSNVSVKKLPSALDVDLPLPSGDNSLGISLDASGTVKENRFPRWQPQVPLNHPPATIFPAVYLTRGALSPQHHSSAMASYHPNDVGRIADGGSESHGRSQTMPVQRDISLVADAGFHERAPSWSHADPAGLDRLHQPNNGQPDPVAPYPMHESSRMISDSPTVMFYVRVIYDYEATIPEELSLKEGDILGVLRTRDDGWWEGNLMDEYRGPMRGLFPSNFTEPTA